MQHRGGRGAGDEGWVDMVLFLCERDGSFVVDVRCLGQGCVVLGRQFKRGARNALIRMVSYVLK